MKTGVMAAEMSAHHRNKIYIKVYLKQRKDSHALI